MSQPALFDVSGRVAVVTGASSGLGRVAATLLAMHGARVFGIARRAGELTAWPIKTTGETTQLVADLADRSALVDIAHAAEQPFGAPDILINAAGINTRQHGDDVTPDKWDITQNLNLAALFFLAQAMVGAMKAKGWGRIVNFASLQSSRAVANVIAYGAFKGAIAQLTRAMAEAWSPHGIRTNAIAPGFIRAELTSPVFADYVLAARHANNTCIGRNGEPGDINDPLLFLCSDACGYVTGQVLAVDGGYTAK